MGRARRVGCDLALQLITKGQLDSQWICSGDADACWSDALFDQVAKQCERDNPAVYSCPPLLIINCQKPPPVRITTTPLRTATDGDKFVVRIPHVGQRMRFFNAEAYAAVRGMPLRSAAEDFYTLNKLAKIAPVHRATGPMVTIDARTSSRVPFGTGPAVQKLTESAAPTDEPIFYDARCFETLNRVHQLFERWISVETINYSRDNFSRDLADLDQRWRKRSLRS